MPGSIYLASINEEKKKNNPGFNKEQINKLFRKWTAIKDFLILRRII